MLVALKVPQWLQSEAMVTPKPRREFAVGSPGVGSIGVVRFRSPIPLCRSHASVLLVAREPVRVKELQKYGIESGGVPTMKPADFFPDSTHDLDRKLVYQPQEVDRLRFLWGLDHG